ncbi:Fur family transcriptional regulator [Actinotignum timonense]|uniref:Fur family transcriptional regulator n=1 Tax=Actinotignum TaxID=1653174 RepID=UPI00254FA86F|nr:Fur family transcriptional regulator [Actinotignum timonense]MDK6906605.1 Fur family transcriptional regulator [Actinotignum timonense]MDK8782117.1 Fur family transcriptional regulator [Actinotignum timonense]MDY5138278.1 Fur family transcriptional regulator [Actinotignum timonense]
MNASKPRVTAQRIAISKMVETIPEFVSAQELHEKLSREGQRIGLATVYRTLQAMADEGILDTMQEGTETLYRYCETEEHHHHLMCRRCGKTVEIALEGAEDWVRSIATANGFSDVDHTLELIGVCADCAGQHTGRGPQRGENTGRTGESAGR